MRRAARILGQALLLLAALLALAALVTAALGLYLGTWPLRRAARRNPSYARLVALQEVLVALAGVVAVRRGRQGEPLPFDGDPAGAGEQ